MSNKYPQSCSVLRLKICWVEVEIVVWPVLSLIPYHLSLSSAISAWTPGARGSLQWAQRIGPQKSLALYLVSTRSNKQKTCSCWTGTLLKIQTYKTFSCVCVSWASLDDVHDKLICNGAEESDQGSQLSDYGSESEQSSEYDHCPVPLSLFSPWYKIGACYAHCTGTGHAVIPSTV